MPPSWNNITNINSKSYVCGYCSNPIASEKGFFGTTEHSQHVFVYICHKCFQPTYFSAKGEQFPGVPYGEEVLHIPTPDIAALYKEARNCIAVNAFTGSVLCSRKLLMNIAVSKGAAEGESFVAYVDYLASKGYVPPDGTDWVDHIRKKGNEATHQIKIMAREDAEDLVVFVEALLKFIYEYPGMIKQKKGGAVNP